MHDVLITGIQTLVILIGILMNRASIRGVRREMNAGFDIVSGEFKGLRAEMNSHFDKMDSKIDARFDKIDAGLRYLHGTIGELRGRIDMIEKRSS